MSYLHIGQNAMLPEKRIIGIFDLDITSQSKRTREFLEKAEQEGVVVPEGGEPLVPAVDVDDLVYEGSSARGESGDDEQADDAPKLALEGKVTIIGIEFVGEQE